MCYTFEPALPKWCTPVPSCKNLFLHLISVVFILSVKPNFPHLVWMMIMRKEVLSGLMDTNRLPKQALRYKPKGRRNIGRPRKRWRDQLHLEDQGTGNTPNPSGTWWWWCGCTVISSMWQLLRCCYCMEPTVSFINMLFQSWSIHSDSSVKFSWVYSRIRMWRFSCVHCLAAYWVCY